MYRAILAISLLMLPMTLLAAGGHTKADGVFVDPVIEKDSGLPYVLYDETQQLHLNYSVNGDHVDAEASANLGPVDITIRGIRVYYNAIYAKAVVKGECEGKLVTGHNWSLSGFKLYQNGNEIKWPPNVEPNTTVPFDGGQAILYAVQGDAPEIDVYGIIIHFNDGEDYTFAHAYASIGCTTPVELLSFDIS